MNFATADLWDQYANQLTYLDLDFNYYGQKNHFHGEIVTLKVFEDNTLVRELLSQNGKGKVLVVDGGGSKRCALVGDNIAQLAIDNGWEGILIYGAIRDAAVINTMDISILALGTSPVKSIKRNTGIAAEPLLINGIRIIEGNCLYADLDGVLFSEENLID